MLTKSVATPPLTVPGAVLLTPEQVAKWLQISKRSLWRLRSEGDLPPPLKLRKSVRWRVADIEDWLAKGCPTRTGS